MKKHLSNLALLALLIVIVPTSVNAAQKAEYAMSGLRPVALDGAVEQALSSKSSQNLNLPSVRVFDGTIDVGAASVSMAIPVQHIGAEVKADSSEPSPVISPVPLPAAVWSFLLGVLGILGVKKRKQVAAQSE